MTKNGDGRTAVLYARVSTDEQVKGYSLRQQIEACREWCEREGYEVLEEVTDPGEGGAYLERPGLDRVRDLVEAGNVSVVLAQDADRITRDPIHRAFLDEEMERHGTRLLALDDWGDETHEGELLRYMKGWVSKGERLKIAERTRRGLLRKVAEGKIIKTRRAPYGFAYSDGGNSLVVAPEMATVRAIFRMIGAEGATLGEVIRRLEAEGVPSPSGPAYNWHRPTIRRFVRNPLYRPLAASEVAGLYRPEVSEEVARSLDPERSYGLWAFNTTRQTKRRERGEDGEYRDRFTYKVRPPEEWGLVPVDLSEANLSREVVDAARERLAQNGRRPPSNQSQRFWVLSGGVVRCAVCGSVLSPHTTTRRTKKPPGRKLNFYYQCRQRYNSGPRDCTNTRSHRAAPLEESIWRAVRTILFEPELVLAAYDRYIEHRKAQLRGDPGKEASRLAGRLQELDEERRGFLRLSARGAMSDAELDSELARVDTGREAMGRALSEAQGRQETVERLQRDRELVFGRFAAMRGVDLRNLVPERRHQVLKALRIRAEVDEKGDVLISGVFDADIIELLPMYNHPVGLPYRVRFKEEVLPPHKGVVALDSLSRRRDLDGDAGGGGHTGGRRGRMPHHRLRDALQPRRPVAV